MRIISILLLACVAASGEESAKHRRADEAKRNDEITKLRRKIDAIVDDWQAKCRTYHEELQQKPNHDLGCVVPQPVLPLPSPAPDPPKK